MLILVGISGFLLYKGVQEEFNKRQQDIVIITTPIPTPHILGEKVQESTASTDKIAEGYLVTKVVDGDTFEVLIEGKLYRVRLIGVDTPETVHPSQPKGCFGAEASAETKRLLTGKRVILEKDVSENDKYNRLLRYAYVGNGNGQLIFVNDYLVREGFAQVLTYPPDVAFNEQFLAAQTQAKNLKKGLWGRCNL